MREQSITSLSLRNLTLASIVENKCSLVSKGSSYSITRNSLLMKFSSLPNLKSLQSRSYTSLPSQYPFRSKMIAFPCPKLGIRRKMSAPLFLPFEAECTLTTPQMGTRMGFWVVLNLTQSQKICWNSSKSSELMLLMQQSLDLEMAISLLRLPIISAGISSHSLNQSSRSFTSGPFSICPNTSSFQISNSHSQTEPSLILYSNLRGQPCIKRLAASMSFRWRIERIIAL